MSDQQPAAQHAYRPTQFQFLRHNKKQHTACELSAVGPKAPGATTTGFTHASQSLIKNTAAEGGPAPVRLPEAPLLPIRKLSTPLPSGSNVRSVSALQPARLPDHAAPSHQHQPLLPLHAPPLASAGWKRALRRESTPARKDAPPLLSKLAKLTGSSGTVMSSGSHIAGVLPPPCASHEPMGHDAASLNAAQSYPRQGSCTSAAVVNLPSQKLTGLSQPSKHGSTHNRQTAIQPSPNESLHKPAAGTPASSLSEAHSPAQSSQRPTELFVPADKPKSTLHSRLRLQRPPVASPTPVTSQRPSTPSPAACFALSPAALSVVNHHGHNHQQQQQSAAPIGKSAADAESDSPLLSCQGQAPLFKAPAGSALAGSSHMHSTGLGLAQKPAPQQVCPGPFPNTGIAHCCHDIFRTMSCSPMLD